MNLNLNDLTLDNIGQWPKPVKLSVIGVLALLLIGLGYWLIAKKNFQEYDSLKAQEATLKVEFETKQRQASSLEAYRNQMALMEERFGKMLQQLPTQNEMPGLLEDISKTGIASGLTFESFAPLPEIQHDFYIELPIKVEVLGNYHQFAIFLSRIAQMNRIVTLHDFSVAEEGAGNAARVPAEQKPNPNNLLSMKMTAKIYRYRTQ